MRVLLGQLEPVPGDVDANAAAIAAALAAHPDADIAVFPELFLTGYESHRAASLALTADDAPLPTIASLARKHRTAVVLGFAERFDGGVANAVGCIDSDGRWAGSYHKTHLFGPTERSVFVPGASMQIIELLGRKVGPLNCFDVEFPEPARALARGGAELFITIAANMAPYGPDHALAARARALDNRLPHIYVNRVGPEIGLDFVGGSAVVAAGGRMLAELGSDRELAVVELPLDRSVVDDVNYLEHLRGDLPVNVVPTNGVQGANQ